MEKIEQVARAICAAHGKDPDDDSGQGPLETIRHQTSSLSWSISQERRPRPNWHDYEEEAAVFIAAHAALVTD